MSHVLAVFSNAVKAEGDAAEFKKSVNAGRLLDEVTFSGISVPADKQCRIRGWFSTPSPDHDPDPALRVINPTLMDLSYVKDNKGMAVKAEHALSLPSTIPASLRKMIELKYVGGVVGGVTKLQQFDNGLYGEAELYYDEDPTSLAYQARKAVEYSKQGGPRIKTSLEGTYFKSNDGVGTKPTAVVVTWTPVNTETDMEIAKSLHTDDGWLKYQEWVAKSFTPTYTTDYSGMTNADALVHPTKKFTAKEKIDLIARATADGYDRVQSYIGDDDKTCVILDQLFCPNDGPKCRLVTDDLLNRLKSLMSKQQ